jgi:hypothetical protein
MQLNLFHQHDWYSSRVEAAEQRVLQAIKTHGERKTKYQRVKFYRTAQLKAELASKAKRAA